jgi:hypothetical protein
VFVRERKGQRLGGESWAYMGKSQISSGSRQAKTCLSVRQCGYHRLVLVAYPVA